MRFGQDMARWLYEPHYWDSRDRLNWFMTGNDPPSKAPDPIRAILQKVLPLQLLDGPGRDRRHVDLRQRKSPFGETIDCDVATSASHTIGTELAAIQAFDLQAAHISPVIDRLACLLIALMGKVSFCSFLWSF